MTSRFGLLAMLVLLGAGWGLTQPLAKIAVSTGREPFGLIFWQFLLGALFLTVIQVIRRRPLPVNRTALRVYVIIALIGTLLPNAASFMAYVHLPAGIMSILISTVPMMAFPLALLLGADSFSWARLAGLMLGLVGIVLLIAPQGSLPDPSLALWVLVGLIAPAFYAVEANYVGHWGTSGLGAVQVLLGASIIGTLLCLPLALVSGQFFVPTLPLDSVDWALIGSSLIHAMAYAGYVWLVGQAGSTFAAQVAYLVTGCGVFWAMLLLGERFSGWVWLALIMVLGGVALVQPRSKDDTKPDLVDGLAPGQNDAT